MTSRQWVTGAAVGAGVGAIIGVLGALIGTSDSDHVGALAAWVSAVGTVGAFAVTYRLLREEVAARRKSEADERSRRRREVAHPLLGALRSTYQETRKYGASYLDPGRCHAIAVSIDDRRFRIDDDDLREHLHVVQKIAQVLSWSEEAFNRSASRTRPTNRAVATLRLQEMLGATVAALEAYFNDQPLPQWDHKFPPTVSAEAWIQSAPPD